MTRKLSIIIVLCFSIFCCIGCNKSQKPVKDGDLDFTVVSGTQIPEELQSLIEKRKEKPFSLSFSDQKYLYVVKGYGAQDCTGYQIIVRDFYKSSEGIYFDCELLGPKEATTDVRTSYPYIVIKTEYTDLPLTFAAP